MPMHAPSPCLPQFMPLAQSLARQEARLPDDVEDLIQEGMFALHKALRGNNVEKPFAFARTVMQRAMERARHRNHAPGQWLPFSQVGDVPIPGSHQEDLLELESYFRALEQQCGPQARQVAENLVAPQDPRCCQRILKDVRRTQQRLRMRRLRAGKTRYGNKQTIHISSHQVRMGLGISQQRWGKLLSQIKVFTRGWLAEQ